MKAQLKQLELTTFIIDDGVYYAAPLEGYELYWASTCGFIISTRNLDPKVLQGKETHNGYLRVCINTTPIEKVKDLRVHRLVAATFYDYEPIDYNGKQRLEVNHINGIKTYNQATNLEWCSSDENVAHFNSVTRVLKQLSKEL
tara:strand:+ start:766 stop:1194 length:429 start_codon:yes stop_codon:yes gene_type:complete